MRFKIDENLPVELANMLGAAGHDAVTVTQERLQGSPDPEIAAVCIREHRILVTLDLDFADIRAYPPLEYPGFIVLRVARQDKHQVTRVFDLALRLIGLETLQNRLWIVDETRVRIRGGE